MRRHLLAIGAMTAAAATGVALTSGSSFAATATRHAAPVAAPVAAPASADGPAAVAKPSADVDGDGYADLLVGAPGGEVGGHAKAGYVTLVYGSKNGAAVGRHQGLTQAHPGVPGTPEAGDRFGSAVALADVDGDGHADAIIGASGEAIGSVKKAGSVTIVFGSATGLTEHAIAFHAPTVTTGEQFGGRLVVGDFNHDGIQDLALGDGSKVDVMYGSKTLRATPTPKLTRITPPGGGEGVGQLSTGDVNGDGYTDLVTVAYFDDPADEGTLGVLPGGKSGLSAKPLGKDIGLPFADYGTSVGDINGDGKDDVVIDTGFSDGPDDFKLRTFPGTSTGLDAADAVVWSGAPQDGQAVTLGDFDGDGHADLILRDTNAPDSDGFQGAGALTVIRGGADWLSPSGIQPLTLDTPGVAGVAESGDDFGASLATGDFNGDGKTDLAVGAPGKWLAVGAVSMLYGGGTGLTGTGSMLFGPNVFNYPEDNAAFGGAVSNSPAK